MATQPLNILFIHTDQQRRDLIGCYGDDRVKTPHMDALAGEGVLFDNCFTPIPICAPARASLLTGLLPGHHGITRNSESGSPDGRDFLRQFPTFSEILNERGYDCTHVGKWHVGTRLKAEDCGFKGVHYPGYGYPSNHAHYREYLEQRGLPPFSLEKEFCGRYRDGSPGARLAGLQNQPEEAAIPYYLAEQTIAALQAAASSGQPFFSRIDFWGPHEPCFIPEPYFSMYDDLDLEPWPNFEESFENKPRAHRDYADYWSVQDFSWADWQKVVRAYYGYTTLIDAQIGRIIEALKTLGLYERTAIFMTSDHGGMLGAHRLCDKGPFLYDEILRIPFIARVPGVTEVGGRNANYIYNYDLMPTFLDVAGAPVPDGLDARSVLPVLRGEETREPVMFGEFYGHQCPVSLRVIRTERLKYVFNGADIDELYDLTNDPGELTNRVQDPAYRNDLAEMRGRLLERLKSTKDPILRYLDRSRVRSPATQ